MTEREMDISRIEGVVPVEILKHSRVVIVGVGSLGSEISELLAMCGVGEFTLIDPDLLGEENIVRHGAGKSYVGKPKVEAMKNIILKERNPQAKILALTKDACSLPREIFEGDLAIITGLGSNERELFIADNLRKKGITTILAGVYDKGEGGEVCIINPNQGPCYLCICEVLDRPIGHIGRIPPPYNQEQGQLIPALNTDIVRIATIAADASIKFLVGRPIHEDPGVNLVMFANRKMKIGEEKNGKEIFLNEFQSLGFRVKKNPKCALCSEESHQITNISFEEALRRGGDLNGKRE